MYDLAQFTFDPRTEEYIDRHGNRKCAREVLAHWLSDELNAGRVPCFAGQEVKPDDRGIQIGDNNTQINTFRGTEK